MADLYLLIDHDNLNNTSTYFEENIEPLLERIILTRKIHSSTKLDVSTRIYGGWNQGFNATDRRANAFLHYSTNWPSIVTIQNIFVRIEIVFADTLAINSKVHGSIAITHTLKAQNKMPWLSRTVESRSCEHENCEIRRVSNWIRKKRGCFNIECDKDFSYCFSRLEQKQVDVHIGTDLILLTMLSESSHAIGICSDDIDFTPALMASSAILSHGSSPKQLYLIRSNQRPHPIDSQLKTLGVFIANGKHDNI